MCESEWHKEAHAILGKPYDPDASLPPSFFTGRSQCPHCHHTLSVIDLIPVVSYLILKGKCRHCQASISPMYPSLELACLALSLPLLFSAHSLFELTLLTAIFCSLLLVAVFDARHKWIPDEINLLLVGCALLLALQQPIFLTESVLGLIVGYALIAILRSLFMAVRKVEAIGLGDAKLLAGLGAWLGVYAIAPIALIASLLGIFYILVSGHNKDHQVAFGPFLAIAAFIYYWYTFFI